MSKPENFFEDLDSMTGIDIQTLVSCRLEDMAEQVELLYSQGKYTDAEIVRTEGLEIASAYDDGLLFMYLPDFTSPGR